MSNFLDMIKSAAAAGCKFVMGGFQIVDESTHNYRQNICNGCEWWRERNKCGHCGCDLNLKLWWPKEQCPISKWGEEEA